MDNLKRKKVSLRYLILASIIAALYAGVTLLIPAFSYGMVQFRFSEMLIALTYFEPAAFPGICIGCFVANILGPGAFYDAVIGTSATVLGLLAMRLCSSKGIKPWIGMSLYALINALLVGLELCYIIGVNNGYSLTALILWVLLGEAVTAVGGGSALYMLLKKRWKDLTGETKKSEE